MSRFWHPFADMAAVSDAACRVAGVLTRALAPGALQVSPPLVIGGEELDELATGLRAVLDSALGD
jgi:adenosylmethionine-8-amino-7-oxononanoate aminotransferase